MSSAFPMIHQIPPIVGMTFLQLPTSNLPPNFPLKKLFFLQQPPLFYFYRMSINSQLESRSNHVCELCSSTDDHLVAYTVPPKKDDSIDHQVVLCKKCFSQISEGNYTDINHWRCLTGSIWSEVPAVQALSYKMLNKLSAEDWATETLETVFFRRKR